MASSPRPARILGARPLDGREHHEAPRSRALLGGYLEGHGARRGVLGKVTNIKHNTTSKRLLVTESVLGAFRTCEWLIERSMFMDGAKIDLARRSRVDVEALTQ